MISVQLVRRAAALQIKPTALLRASRLTLLTRESVKLYMGLFEAHFNDGKISHLLPCEAS